jgi:hypothetical protein
MAAELKRKEEDAIREQQQKIEELKKLLSVEPEESANTTSITIRVPSG